MSMPTTGLVIEPYLFFEGRCEEALEFYRKALDAEVTALMRYKDSPDPSQCGPVPLEKVMHASFRVGKSQVMASDGRCEGGPKFLGFGLTLAVDTEAEADKRFGALTEGGQVLMPLGATFFSPKFGMVVDKFGITWMVIVAHEQTGAAKK
jgi:PhnB protein